MINNKELLEQAKIHLANIDSSVQEAMALADGIIAIIDRANTHYMVYFSIEVADFGMSRGAELERLGMQFGRPDGCSLEVLGFSPEAFLQPADWHGALFMAMQQLTGRCGQPIRWYGPTPIM